MAGLSRSQALTYSAQTVMGAAAMILETGKHPGELKDSVCSPAGSTIVGVAALERKRLIASTLCSSVFRWDNSLNLLRSGQNGLNILVLNFSDQLRRFRL